jgi:hypothetical protein
MDRVHQHRHRGDVPAPTPVVAEILPVQVLPTPVQGLKRQEDDDLDVPDEIDASEIADADETDLGTELALASGEATVSQTQEMAGDQPPTSQLSIPSPSTSSAPSDNAEEGMSAGAKAGIAFGVLGGALLLGLILYFIVSHRRKAMAKTQPDDGEKSTNGVAPPPPPKSAPRLSLRPVTQFFPNLGFDKNNQGNGKGLPPPNGAPYERPDTSQSNYANPFGKGAERVPSPVNEEPVSPVSPVSAASPPRAVGQAAATTAGAAGAAGAGAYVARKTSLRAGPQKNLPKRPVSPVGSEYSMSSIYTANGPNVSLPSAQPSPASAGSPKTNVHRVQLDFKPTLPDEMELRPGDLVQLLHEYDDGWVSEVSAHIDEYPD